MFEFVEPVEDVTGEDFLGVRYACDPLAVNDRTFRVIALGDVHVDLDLAPDLGELGSCGFDVDDHAASSLAVAMTLGKFIASVLLR